jgi:hypothetical protein
MLESFALNGRVGDIGIKDKVIEVKLVFPNDERTQDELAFLFPIKKGLATVRIIAAVNKGYVPGRRRSDRDETGTPLLPGVVDMNEICHACGRTMDCVNEPFFAKPVKDGKEIILCDACYRVPQPETIETPAVGAPGDPPPEGASPAQLEQAADSILDGVPPEPKVCATCGHPHRQPFVKEKAGTAGVKHFWRTNERNYEICPSCGAENQFPEEGGEG